MVITEQELERVRQEADRLMDRMMELGCESCRVFISATVPDGSTVSDSCGRGNFNAQLGQTRGWVIQQDEVRREKARREADEDQ